MNRQIMEALTDCLNKGQWRRRQCELIRQVADGGESAGEQVKYELIKVLVSTYHGESIARGESTDDRGECRACCDMLVSESAGHAM